MTDNRYSVTLSATCDEAHLKTALDRIQATLPNLVGLGLEGFAVNVYRLDDDDDLEPVPADQLPIDTPAAQ
jgi:hypothetical protein